MSRYNKTIITLASSIIIIVFSTLFIFTPYTVRGDSMSDTLKRGDVVMALNKGFAQFIGLWKPAEPEYLRDRIIIVNTGNGRMIKRCIGLPGDTLILDMDKYADSVYVPINAIFTMGDNYRNSYDSRNEGCFAMDDIEAFPIYIYFSFYNGIKWNRMGIIN